MYFVGSVKFLKYSLIFWRDSLALISLALIIFLSLMTYIICLMLFFTICILSSSLSIKNSMTANLTTLAPIDIELYKTVNMTEEHATQYGYSAEVINDSKISINDTLNKLNFDIKENFKDITDVFIYASNDLTVKDTLGNSLAYVKENYPYLDLNSAETIMTISDYNKVAKLYGNETFTLKDNEYILVADFDGWIDIRNKALENNSTITILGNTYYPKYKEIKNGFLNISSNHINAGIFVVPDKAVNDSLKEQEHLLANYKANDEEGKKEIENKIDLIGKENYAKNTNLSASTKLSIYEGSVGLGALVTFIGLYLGIIFLISSAAILALKELSESTDNKERYNMLKKLGAREKMINKALFRQIGVFFLFPLILAIIHSIFGIIFCNYLLETFGDEKLLKSIIMTALFLIIIYGSYFIITYLCSKNIIKDER